MKYVIIGNSAAAVGTIEGIRQVDREGEILLIASEPYHTYSRPLISYLLGGKTTRQKMKYRPDAFYEKNGVTPLLGRTVACIHPEEKTVVLEDGETIGYDKLMVATGSRPFIPPMEGLEKVRTHTFMSLDDAKALEQGLGRDKKTLIIGAGLIGLKCAEGIYEKVAGITVVDLANRILPSILDEQGSAMVQKHIEAKGVRFILSDSVQRLEAKHAVLKSGGQLDFDVLVMAVGVRPNVELIRNAGGQAGRGVVIDDHCRTSLPGVYSAGDCCESHDITCGEKRILALLPNAYMQGECAGVNMAGAEKVFDKAIPMNAIGFFGLHMITAGSYEGECYLHEAEGEYKKLFYQDGLLKGYILIGNVERAGIYTSLIRERTPLNSIDFELIKEKPQLMAFSTKERVQKLGGAGV